jgi:hypothetical protein
MLKKTIKSVLARGPGWQATASSITDFARLVAGH